MKRFTQVGGFIRMGSFWATCLAATLMVPLAAQAQFTASNQTITIDGATNVWSGDYYVGNNASMDVLTIQNGGMLTNVGTLNIGFLSADSNNSVVVNGKGSQLINVGYQRIGQDGSNNQMIITNGAKVLMATTIPYTASVGNLGNNNLAVVSGSNSVWDVQLLTLGQSMGSGNQVRIVNGGTMFIRRTAGEKVAIGLYGNGNSIVVSDTGSLLQAYCPLYVGWGNGSPGYASNNLLNVTNGGTVNLPGSAPGYGLVVGDSTLSGNVVRVDGGNLWVTNAAGNQFIDVRRGRLTINSGNVLADKLIMTNANAAALQFNGGNLSVKNIVASNGTAFVVGNGSSAATLNLVSAAGVVGTHSFSNGLVIAANATLAIGGTNTIRQVAITGDVTLQTGAILDLDFNQSTNDYAQVYGTLNVASTGTLRLRALDASTRVPITVMQATQINGTPTRWPAVNVNGSNYQVYVVGNQLVIKRPLPPPGTMVMLR